MTEDWKAVNIDDDEVLRLITEKFTNAVQNDTTVAVLLAEGKIDKYSIYDFYIFEYDYYSLEEIFEGYFVIDLIFEIGFKTALHYSIRNKFTKVIRDYNAGIRFQYLVHKEIIIATKILETQFNFESEMEERQQ